MGRGDRLVMACVILLAIEVLLVVLLSITIVVATVVHPEVAEAHEFRMHVKDTPVLNTVQQVWKAQTTGVSEFDFDGVHYVIEDLPQEYVKYSSWYCRMP